MQIRRCLTLVVLELLVAQQILVAAPVRIMPLGDSITYRYGKDNKAKIQNYRYWLWRRLIDEGIAFDFVGTKQDEYIEKWPSDYPDYQGYSMDPDNEGNRGATYNSINNSFKNALKTVEVDWVLVYGGANDLRYGCDNPEEVGDKCRETIRIAREANPDMVIFVGLLATCAESSCREVFNARQRANCEELTTEQSPVYAVDFGHVEASDGCHVSTSGGKTMADGWIEAIKAHLDGEPGVDLASSVTGTSGGFLIRASGDKGRGSCFRLTGAKLPGGNGVVENAFSVDGRRALRAPGFARGR